MRTAARQRTAEPPPIASDDHDAIAVLGRQHSQIRYLLKQLQALPSHTTGGSAEHISARKTITDMVTGRLSAHERIEEEHLWPTVRAVLPDGDQLADTAVQQEQEGKDSLTELGRLNPDSREFDEQVEKFVRQVRIHVAFEEKVFLRLREAMPPAGLNALGERLLSEAEMAQEEGRPLWASGRGSTHGRSTGSSRVWTRWPGARQSRAAAARSWRRGRAQPTR
jgi:hemerythrin-like domain-containing protein